ncbi:hypothetical protein [Microvirga massiliensis]|uniref:hypothetical protein n=1 Tax=Microvirga massiliensis TaxID=1033741 RepID=UPI00062B3FE1|nr:hypothetical protein [Microvirga massiliensis]
MPAVPAHSIKPGGQRTLSWVTLALLRGMFLALASAGAFWSLSVIPGEREAAPLNRLANRILAGRTPTLEALAPTLAYLDRSDSPRGCSSPALRPIATIRLYAAALAHSTAADESAKLLLQKARRDIHAFLRCAPHQSFYWYALFWVEMALGGDSHDHLPLLEFSYRLGPHEGWISAYRCRDALPYYEMVNPPTQKHIREEYLSLVRENAGEAAAILRLGDAEIRSRVLEFITVLPLEIRESFARRLDSLNIEVDVPGVDYEALYSRPNLPKL